MDINLDAMTAEELDELLAQIQAKLEELQNPPADEEREDEEPEEGGEEKPEEKPEEGGDEEGDELPDDLDQLEELINEIEGRKNAIKAHAEKRSALIKRIAAGEKGRVIRKFNESEDKKMFGVETKEYRNAWLKNLQGKDISAEERGALTGGSYVIPQETANKIWGKAELYPLFNAVDVMHVPGTLVLPVEGTVNSASVVAMGNAATDSQDSVSAVSLGIYKIIKTIEITADVAAMAVSAFEDWLVDRLANKLYRAITGYIAAGTGSSQPTGLTSVDATGHTYTKAAITYADLLAIIAALSTEYLPGATFVMSRTTFWQNVMAVEDSNHNPIVVQDVQSPAKFNIFGYPVILEDDLSTDIVFGDLKEGYVWNFGKDIAIDRDSSVGFRAGSEVFRGMCLADGKPTGVGLVRYTKAT